MNKYTFPKKDGDFIEPHTFGSFGENCPAYLSGTWVQTDKLIDTSECPAGTVVKDDALDDYWWYCNGYGRWAGVNHDGRILGFIKLGVFARRIWIREQEDGLKDLIRLMGVSR